MNSTTLTRFKANGNDSSYLIKYCKIHLILYMWDTEFFFFLRKFQLHVWYWILCMCVILNCIAILLTSLSHYLIYCLLFTITFFLIFPLLLDIFIYIFLLKHVLKKKKTGEKCAKNIILLGILYTNTKKKMSFFCCLHAWVWL